MNERDISLSIHFEAHVLRAWMKAGWLSPPEPSSGGEFSQLDVARAYLIRDLKDNFGVNDEGVDLILDLVDQIHGLRRTLRQVLHTGPLPKAVAMKRVRLRGISRLENKRAQRRRFKRPRTS